MYKHAKGAQEYSHPQKKRQKRPAKKVSTKKVSKRLKEVLLAEERHQKHLEARRQESRASREAGKLVGDEVTRPTLKVR